MLSQLVFWILFHLWKQSVRSSNFNSIQPKEDENEKTTKKPKGSRPIGAMVSGGAHWKCREKSKSVKFHSFSMHVRLLCFDAALFRRTLHLIFRVALFISFLPFFSAVHGLPIVSSALLFCLCVCERFFILTFNALRSYITRNIMRVKKDFRLKKSISIKASSSIRVVAASRNTFAHGPGSIRLTLGKLISKSVTQNGTSMHNTHTHRVTFAMSIVRRSMILRFRYE